jgi:hypothetical protein
MFSFHYTSGAGGRRYIASLILHSLLYIGVMD